MVTLQDIYQILGYADIRPAPRCLIMASLSGLSPMVLRSSLPYISFVDTHILGLMITSQISALEVMGVNMSPIPWARAVPPVKQKGTSAPKLLPKAFNVSSSICRSHNLLSPSNTPAQSALPPPMPAAMGMFFYIYVNPWKHQTLSLLARSPPGYILICLGQVLHCCPALLSTLRIISSHRFTDCIIISTS